MRISTFSITAVLILFTLLALNACSNVQETSAGTTSYQNDFGDNSLSFKDDGIKWRVDFEDGDISAIYKNGERVPEDDYSKYEEMIYSKISELKTGMHKFHSDMYSFKIDMDKFKDDMKEMNINLRKNLPGKIEIEIDREDFKKGMEVLKEAMKELKTQKFEFQFDKESFREDMKKLKEDLEKIDYDKIRIEVKKNLDDVEKELEKVKIKVKDIDIDLSGLDEELENLDVELEKLDSFLDEMKSELVKDGYIGNVNEKFELTLNADKMTVNDQKVSDQLRTKYLSMYEKHFGKKIEGKFRINLD
jgi:chromosome segregation ATPase